jgi:hypothetical protein
MNDKVCPICNYIEKATGHTCPPLWSVRIAETDSHHEPTEPPTHIYAPRADLAVHIFVEDWDNIASLAIARGGISVSIIATPVDNHTSPQAFSVRGSIIPHYEILPLT